MQILSFNTGGVNTYTNPLIPASNAYSAVSGLNQINQGAQQDGVLIRAVNVDSYPYGGKSKRAGYTTYLGTPDNSSPLRLFNWTKDDGTFFNYRQSGSSLYYSIQGTGDWTKCANGTLTVGSQLGNSVLNNTLIISQGGGTTRHSTTGTTFSDTSAAPAGPHLTQYQNRIYITGTSSTLFYSVSGDPTNWSTSGTSDSSSITIPGAGLPNSVFVLANRLNITKSSGRQLNWDGFTLADLASNLGPSSPYSIVKVEDYGFWLNRLGFFSSNGDQPQLISNAIQREIYNDQQSGILGATFGTAPSIASGYDYLTAVGSVRDDLTNEPLNNCIIKYNYQKNEFLNYSFNDFPTAFGTYIDTSGNRQTIFSNSGGQCFQYSGTSTSDNGNTIEAKMEFFYHFNQPHVDKEFRWIWLFFNPGCQAQVQVATASTFTKQSLKWLDVGDVSDGLKQFRFPAGSKGKFLFLRISEASRNARFTYYGCAIDANLNPQA